MIELLLKDKHHKMQEIVYQCKAAGWRIIICRYAAVGMALLPVLMLSVKSLVTLVNLCGDIGCEADSLAFVKYIFGWILPAIMFVIAISLFITVFTENYLGIFSAALLWLLGRPSVDKISGGNYEVFDIVIRHNTLKGYGRMMQNLSMLILNRAVITMIAIGFVILSIVIYYSKRRGGFMFGRKKYMGYFANKFSSGI